MQGRDLGINAYWRKNGRDLLLSSAGILFQRSTRTILCYCRKKAGWVQFSSAFFFDSKALDVIGEMEVALASGLSSRPDISRENLFSGSTRAFFLQRSFSMNGSSEMLWDCSLRTESLC